MCVFLPFLPVDESLVGERQLRAGAAWLELQRDERVSGVAVIRLVFPAPGKDEAVGRPDLLIDPTTT
jgi:hypothetical protein